LIKFPPVGGISGLRLALQSRIDGIRTETGIGEKKFGWLGTVEGGTFQRRNDYFRCQEESFAICMENISRLESTPLFKEHDENIHCKVCKADWNQQGPKCRHCFFGDQLSELEPDRVTVFLLNTLHNILRGSLGTAIIAQSGDAPNLVERAKLFFDVLEAQRREKVMAWRFWRTHLDLLNDIDELHQCKESMRLSYENEDLTAFCPRGTMIMQPNKQWRSEICVAPKKRFGTSATKVQRVSNVLTVRKLSSVQFVCAHLNPIGLFFVVVTRFILVPVSKNSSHLGMDRLLVQCDVGCGLQLKMF
jgi:hypothetical protein